MQFAKKVRKTMQTSLHLGFVRQRRNKEISNKKTHDKALMSVRWRGFQTALFSIVLHFNFLGGKTNFCLLKILSTVLFLFCKKKIGIRYIHF